MFQRQKIFFVCRSLILNGTPFVEDCKKELQALLQEERLLGATLLVFANKQDLPGALNVQQIREVIR